MPRPNSDREIYPNAPLEFVACEVKFPYTPGLADSSRVTQIQRALYETFPLVQPAVSFEVSPGSAPLPFAAAQMLGLSGVGNLLRFLSRDRQLGVLITPESVSVETTRYSRYEELRDRVRQVLDAVKKVEPTIPGISRIGLRYIDEIRVSKGVSAPADWAKFVDKRLVGPLTLKLGTTPPETVQGTLQYNLGGSKRVVMRFGVQKGRAIGDAPLRRRKKALPEGLYFLVDIDSFWTGQEPLTEFSIDVTLATCDELHRPVRQLFEGIITDRLRDEVLRNAHRGN